MRNAHVFANCSAGNRVVDLMNRSSVRSFVSFLPGSNVAFSRGTGWRGLCSAQTVTDRTVGYNAWLDCLILKYGLSKPTNTSICCSEFLNTRVT